MIDDFIYDKVFIYADEKSNLQEFFTFIEVVVELADAGQTMLIVTHEMQFARAIADRVILLADGQIADRSTNAEQFFTDPQTERAKEFLHSFDFERHRSAQAHERLEAFDEDGTGDGQSAHN